MGSGRVGRGGGCKGGPDNNVTIRPPPPPGPAGPWRRVKVNNGPSLRGSVGVEREEGKGVCVGGGQSPRVSTQAAVGRGPKCMCVGGCTCTQVGCRGAKGSQGSSTPVLACGLHLQVCVLETHYCTSPLAHCFCCL